MKNALQKNTQTPENSDILAHEEPGQGEYCEDRVSLCSTCTRLESQACERLGKVTAASPICSSYFPVSCECTEKGWFYTLAPKTIGPFNQADRDEEIAAQLGCLSKHVLASRLDDEKREIKGSDLGQILSITVIKDNPVKTILFLNNLAAQSDEDMSNVGLSGESSAGKSYGALEVAEYFPREERRVYAGASPTNFFHEHGRWVKIAEMAGKLDLKGLFDDEEINNEKLGFMLVDLEHKILIFLDQPHWSLAQRLRPLLSHDSKILRYGITDRSEKHGLRSKIVLLRGYPAVTFATAKSTTEDQERTRMWLLSPSAEQEKLRESLKLLGKKIGDRKTFKAWIDSHPQRSWLRRRVSAIRETKIRNITIKETDWKELLEKFMKKRPYLSPRSQRDWPRLLSLVKGFALLNCFHRKRVGDTIEANQADLDEAVALYDEVATANELGVSPETHKILLEVICPLAEKAGGGVSRKDIAKEFHRLYGRPIGHKRLSEDVIPSLESAGLITNEKNPKDLREVLIYPTIVGHVVDGQEPLNNMPLNSGVREPSTGPLTPPSIPFSNPTPNPDSDRIRKIADHWQEIMGLMVEKRNHENRIPISELRTFTARLDLDLKEVLRRLKEHDIYDPTGKGEYLHYSR